MQTQGSQSDLVTYVAYNDCREYTQVTELPSQNVYMATIELKANGRITPSERAGRHSSSGNGPEATSDVALSVCSFPPSESD